MSVSAAAVVGFEVVTFWILRHMPLLVQKAFSEMTCWMYFFFVYMFKRSYVTSKTVVIGCWGVEMKLLVVQ